MRSRSITKTDPNRRHQFSEHIKKTLQIQYHIELRGTFHNHPSGDPSPSRADIDVTRRIADAGKPLGIAVHDHIIIGSEGHVSLRSKGLL